MNPPENSDEMKDIPIDDVTAQAEAALSAARDFLQNKDVTEETETAFTAAQVALLKKEESLIDPDFGDEGQDAVSNEPLIDADMVDEAQEALEKLASGQIDASFFEETIGSKERTIKNEIQSREDSKRSSEALASAVGAFVTGAAYSAFSDIQQTDTVPPIVPPLVIGGLLGGATYLSSNSDSGFSRIIRRTLGRVTIIVGSALSSYAQSAANATVSSVQSIPSKIGEAIAQTAGEVAKIPNKVGAAAQRKIKETANEISKIPGKAADAALEAVKETADEIARIPGEAADAAKEAVKETAEEIAKFPGKAADAAIGRVKETAEEIAKIPAKAAGAAKEKVEKINNAAKEKAGEIAMIPSNAAAVAKEKVIECTDLTKKRVNNAASETKRKISDAIEEVTALPRRVVNELQEAFDDLTGPEDKQLPVPPKLPPPPLTQAESDSSKIDFPKINLPEIELSKIKLIPSMPLSDTPSSELFPTASQQEQPRFKLPIIEPPKMSLPMIELPKAEKREKKEEDNFVFSETSLQEFIGRLNVGLSEEDNISNSLASIADVSKRSLGRKADGTKKEQEAADFKRKAELERKKERS